MRRFTHTRGIMAMLCVSGLWGCQTKYVTPGQAADFHALGIAPDKIETQTDYGVRDRLSRKPLAGFPTSIAIARVQGNGYSSYTERAYGSGAYSVITGITVEKDEHLQAISHLPMVRGLARLNRLVLPPNLKSEEDLREAAASVQADMLLVYTLDTAFDTGTTVPALGTITLGLFPNEKAKVTTTASAALLDTRNGYVYGLLESSATTSQLANAWTSREAVDDCRKRTEQEAFDKLVPQFAELWSSVVAQYGPGTSSPAVEKTGFAPSR